MMQWFPGVTNHDIHFPKISLLTFSPKWVTGLREPRVCNWNQKDSGQHGNNMYTTWSKIGWPRDPGRPEGSHWTAMTGPTQGSMFLMRHLVRSQMSRGGERAQCFLVTFPARFTLMANFDRKDPNVGDLPRPCFTMNSHCLHFDLGPSFSEMSGSACACAGSVPRWAASY